MNSTRDNTIAFQIKLYPDPILRQRTSEVKEITPDFLLAVETITQILIENNALGLAAQQIGYAGSIIGINTGVLARKGCNTIFKSPVIILANPRILEKEGEVIDEEGCLSFPNLYLNIPRPSVVRVRGQMIVDNEFVWVEFTAKNLFARVLCHEIDHLNGVLFIDLVQNF
jgi:peptide deformylase